MKNFKFLGLIFIFAIPYILVYSALLSGKVLSWGDAPFYYSENLKELFNSPFIWDIRNSNFGAPQFFTLWLFLPTFLLGLLNIVFNLQSSILLRIIFYFPATLLAIFGSWIFLGSYTKNSFVRILGSILYSFNTYFLLLIDGGQIGVALSYGLFPLVIYFLLKYLKVPTLKNYLLSLFFLFLISNNDLRTFVLCLLFLSLYKILEFSSEFDWKKITQEILNLFLVLISLVGLDLFWILPFISGLNLGIINYDSSLNSNIIKLLDGLFLFQPNFPINEFGKGFPVPIYYIFLPVLALGGLFLTKSKWYLKLSLIFLIFVFLVKGDNEPFGWIYTLLVTHLPLGISFRDSSKFFIPLFLMASVLTVLTVDSLKDFNLGRRRFLVLASLYLYLIFLIHPAFFGGLNGGLNNTVNEKDYSNIYQYLSQDSNFSRSIWFSERPPLGFSSWNHPSISANDLAKDHPFASQVSGYYDRFGYLNSDQLKQWFNLLGIKYAFFPLPERQKVWTPKQQIERIEFLSFIDKISFLKSINLNTNFPTFEIDGNLPHIFGQKKMLIVFGGEQIYKKLFEVAGFNLGNQGIVFLEQGNFDPRSLLNIDKDAAEIVLFNHTKDQLAFVFLKNEMLSIRDLISSNWAIKNSEDYLNWKGFLEEEGMDLKDFDYGKGVFYSTIKDEKIIFKTNKNQRGDYILGLRYATASDSGGIKIKLDSFEQIVKTTEPNNFQWNYFEIPGLDPNNKVIELTNLGGVNVINTLVLVDKNIYLEAANMADKLETSLNTYQISSNNDLGNFSNILKDNLIPITYEMKNPTEYVVSIPREANWLTFTDHYNKNWNLENAYPYPFYAMVNGFYLRENSLNDSTNKKLYFRPQSIIPYGIILSLIGAFVILIGAIVYKLIKYERKSS